MTAIIKFELTNSFVYKSSSIVQIIEKSNEINKHTLILDKIKEYIKELYGLNMYNNITYITVKTINNINYSSTNDTTQKSDGIYIYNEENNKDKYYIYLRKTNITSGYIYNSLNVSFDLIAMFENISCATKQSSDNNHIKQQLITKISQPNIREMLNKELKKKITKTEIITNTKNTLADIQHQNGQEIGNEMVPLIVSNKTTNTMVPKQITVSPFTNVISSLKESDMFKNKQNDKYLYNIDEIIQKYKEINIKKEEISDDWD